MLIVARRLFGTTRKGSLRRPCGVTPPFKRVLSSISEPAKCKYLFQQIQYSVDQKIVSCEAKIIVCDEQIQKCSEDIENCAQDIVSFKKIVKTQLENLLLVKEEQKLMLFKKDLVLRSQLEEITKERSSLQKLSEKLSKKVYIKTAIDWGETGGVSVGSQPESILVGQNFLDFRTLMGNYTIDKTEFIPALLRKRRVVYRRPRRFGKSLILSTLEYFFYGAVRLFEGLAIYDLEIKLDRFMWCPKAPSLHKFPPCPVIKLDFSKCCKITSIDDCIKSLHDEINREYERNGVDLIDSSSCSLSFHLESLIISLSISNDNEWRKCVILIDEYDALLREVSSDIALQDKVLYEITSLFRVIKANDSNVLFCFVTGIQSSTLAGIYSGANNFIDLTHSSEFHSLCGHTTEETRSCLSALNIAYTNMEDMQINYNGYSFDVTDDNNLRTRPRETLFNPFFLTMYCQNGIQEDYWSKTASGSIFQQMPLLATTSLPLVCSVTSITSPVNLTNEVLGNEVLGKALLEAGYGSIKNVHEGMVTIDFPNTQIQDMLASDYLRHILPNLSSSSAVNSFRQSGDLFPFITYVNTIISQIPNHFAANYKSEKGFHGLMIHYFYCCDLNIINEESSMHGRSDTVLVVQRKIFIIEFKCGVFKTSEGENGEADRALLQIVDRHYEKSKFVREHIAKGYICQHVAIVADSDKRQFVCMKIRLLSEDLKDAKIFKFL